MSIICCSKNNKFENWEPSNVKIISNVFEKTAETSQKAMEVLSKSELANGTVTETNLPNKFDERTPDFELMAEYNEKRGVHKGIFLNKNFDRFISNLANLKEIPVDQIIYNLFNSSAKPEKYARILNLGFKSDACTVLGESTLFSILSLLNVPALNYISDLFLSKGVDPATPLLNSIEMRVDTYDSLVKKGYPITSIFLRYAIYLGNYPYVDYIFKTIDKAWIEKNANELFSYLEDIDDPLIWELFIQYHPKACSYCPFDKLKEAALNGNTKFLETVLPNYNLKAEEKDILFKNVNDSYCIGSIKLVCKFLGKEYPEVFLNKKELELMDLDKLSVFLFSYCMCSEMSDIYELLSLYPRFSEVFPKVERMIALITRFSKLKYYEYMIHKKVSKAESIQENYKFALENYKYVTQKSKLDEDQTYDQLMKEIIDDRFTRNVKLHEDFRIKIYETKRFKDDPENCPNTDVPLLIYGWRNLGKSSLAERYVLDAGGRYHPSLKNLMTLLYDKEKKEWKIPQYSSIEVGKTPFNVKFKYPLPDGKSLPTTTLVNGISDKYPCLAWIQTAPQTILKMKERVNALHKKIKRFKLNLENALNKKEFFDSVAECYYYAATLCEYKRGTPHYAMKWLNKIYAHHGLPPPIPKISHYFLDNTALMYPMEYFIEQYHTFFEPTYAEWKRNIK